MLSSDLVAHHLIARSCPYLKRLLLLLFFFFFVSSKSGGREDEKPKKGNTSEERMRTKVSTVNNISPSINNTSLTINY
jgi:hypothetical protein